MSSVQAGSQACVSHDCYDVMSDMSVIAPPRANSLGHQSGDQTVSNGDDCHSSHRNVKAR